MGGVLEREDIKHVLFVPSVWHIDREIGQPLVEAALSNGKTINSFYFAHFTGFNEIFENIRNSMANPSDENLFIFKDTDTAFQWGDPSMHYYDQDGVIIGYYGKLDEWDEIIVGDSYAE